MGICSFDALRPQAGPHSLRLPLLLCLFSVLIWSPWMFASPASQATQHVRNPLWVAGLQHEIILQEMRWETAPLLLCGSNVITRMWLGCGSDMARMWLGCDSDVARMWLRCGSDVAVARM